jgi:glucokinase
MNILGIDIGGTKTSICIGNPDGTIHVSQRMRSFPERGFEDYVQRMTALAHEVLDQHGITLDEIDAIGISAPGPLSTAKGELLCAPNMEGWINVPILQATREALKRPVYMNNDANACAIAEWYYGGSKGCENLVYLTMSTGLGAGIIANGQILQGACDLAGEVGYHVLDIDGPESPCGHRGSFEAFCGGKNMADRLREQIINEKIETDILKNANSDPEQINFQAFVQAVQSGDAYACREWETYIERLAQGIGNLIMILNPEAIILGTIAIHTGDFLLKPLHDAIAKYVLPQALEACTIAPSQLGGKIADLSAIAVARYAC